MSNQRQTEIMEQQQEAITGGITNINSDHAVIHMGFGGLADDYFTLTNGAVKEYCFTSPLALFVHFKNIKLNGLGGSVKLEILKGATVTVNTGTDLLITNPNDNSDYLSASSIKESPTYTGGTKWKAIYALSDATRQSTGSADSADSENQELVMKDGNKEYIIKITNLTTDTITVAWNAFWYEEPQGLS